METRIAVIGIIVEEREAAGRVNETLHQYGSYIIGRMGLPYEKKHVSIISIVLDAHGRDQRPVGKAGPYSGGQHQGSVCESRSWAGTGEGKEVKP